MTRNSWFTSETSVTTHLLDELMGTKLSPHDTPSAGQRLIDHKSVTLHLPCNLCRGLGFGAGTITNNPYGGFFLPENHD
jgi:hypothetical protein